MLDGIYKIYDINRKGCKLVNIGLICRFKNYFKQSFTICKKKKTY